MADYYIAQNNGTSSGPFKMDELLAKGLTGETLVWHQGMSQWKAASAMPELVALLASNEAPPLPYASGANNLLQQEIEKTKLEIEELRNKVEKIDQGDIEDLARKPLEFKEKTRYDFRCPTWTKETWMILACVACHFFLGVTKITTFSYIFLDLIFRYVSDIKSGVSGGFVFLAGVGGRSGFFFLAAAAGQHAEDHHQRQQQGKDLHGSFHLTFPPLY